MDKTNVKVEFDIGSQDDIFVPSNATEILGIKPKRTGIKGEIIRQTERGNILCKYTFWRIETDYEESYDIKFQINKIMSVLATKKEQLQKLKRIYKVNYHFCVVIKIENHETPAVWLSKSFIHFLSSIDASVDFDIYNFS